MAQPPRGTTTHWLVGTYLATAPAPHTAASSVTVGSGMGESQEAGRATPVGTAHSAALESLLGQRDHAEAAVARTSEAYALATDAKPTVIDKSSDHALVSTSTDPWEDHQSDRRMQYCDGRWYIRKLHIDQF